MSEVKHSKMGTKPEPVRGLRVLPYTGLKGRTRHLFACWPQMSSVIHSAERLMLFMDFDGTLVSLRARPGDVKPLNPSLRRVLSRLAQYPRLRVCVISGRRLADLRKLVPVRGVQLLGLHGWEGRDVPPLAAERQLLRVGRKLLEERLAGALPHVWVEDKGLGLAVHYRGAPPLVIRRARAIVGRVLKTLGPQIHIVRGPKVWELLPHQIDGKGPAVTSLLAKLPQPMLPIFAGDSTTDESAFRVLRSGLTIHVGANPPAAARCFLRNPEEVKLFLLKLEAAVA